MKFRQTLILAAVVLILGALYYWDQGRRTKQTGEKESDAKLLAYKPTEIDRIVLTNARGEFELVRTKDAEDQDVWSLARPLATTADTQAVKGLVGNITGANKQNPFDLSGGQKPEEYGLDKPPYKAEFFAGPEKSTTIEVGDQGSGAGSYYARFPSEPDKIFQVNPTVKTSIDKSLFDLRDKTLLAFHDDKVTTATAKSTAANWRAVRGADGTWSLAEPADPGNDGAIEDLMRKLQTARAEDFVDTTSTLQLAAYGLDEPVLRLSVYEPKFEAMKTLLVGGEQAGQGRRYAMVEGGKQVFLIGNKLFTDLNKPAADLFEKKLFADVTGQFDVKRMTVGTPSERYTLVKGDDDKWQFDGEPNVQVDDRRVDDLAAQFTNLQIAEFLPSPSSDDTTATQKYNFGAPQLTIELTGAERGKTNAAKIGRIDQNDMAIYAQRGADGLPLRLDYISSDKLIKTRESLTKKRFLDKGADAIGSLDIQNRSGRTTVNTFHFQKEGEGWTGKKEGDEVATPSPKNEMDSLLGAVAQLGYDEKYPPGSTNPDALLAPVNDVETTMTLKSATGEVLLNVGITREEFELRFAKDRDGNLYSIPAGRYADVKNSLDALLKKLLPSAAPAPPQPLA